MSEINKVRNIDKSELINLIKDKSSKQAVLREIGINIKNGQALKFLNDFIKEHKLDTSHHKMGNPAHNRYSYNLVKSSVDESLSWSELMRKLEIKFVGNNITTVRKLVKHYGISIDHFDYAEGIRRTKAERGVWNMSKTFSEMFVENSNVHRRTIKKYIEEHSLIPYKCSGPNCTITDTWNGQPIVLHLEHINGIGNDNRLDNLCFLCPNCHSQTSTYAGRNVQGKKRAVDGSFITLSPLQYNLLGGFIMHWVLIILMFNYNGNTSMTSQSVTGFTTQEACTAQVDWLRSRTTTRDAYCVYVK